jgi:murein L,D-transpeptidase YafK
MAYVYASGLRWLGLIRPHGVMLAALALICCLGASVGVAPALAVTIEIDDVAPDRVERQRAFAEGQLPLAGTPDLGQFGDRLRAKGLAQGAAMFMRVFKAESELEVWMQKDGKFVLFATYPICHWAGTVGPKLREGDKQNPEGFYSVGPRQLHRIGRWPRSLNIGFPNTYDRSYGRTGSYILVHGGCSSVGCFAMTNAVMAEIFALTEQSLRGGQARVDVHVFPFRMSEANLKVHAKSPWIEFWQNLKEGYDAFEETHLPPRVGICDRRYVVEPQRPGEVGVEGPLALCGVSRAALIEPSSMSLAQLPPAPLPQVWPQPLLQQQPGQAASAPTQHLEIQRAAFSGRPLPPLPALWEQVALLPPRLLRPRNPKAGPAGGSLVVDQPPPCNAGLASCRKFLALKSRTDQPLVAGGSRRISRAAGLEISKVLGRLVPASRAEAAHRSGR